MQHIRCHANDICYAKLYYASLEGDAKNTEIILSDRYYKIIWHNENWRRRTVMEVIKREMRQTWLIE